MDKESPSFTRRDFLSQAGNSLTASVLMRAALATGIIQTSVGCGSSSNANPVINPPNDNPDGNSGNRNGTARPSDWPANVGSGTRVIILGAGIAGMCAAYEMQKLGYEVTILEATERAGGRCRTIRSGDVVVESDSEQVCTFDNNPHLYFNPGPARIPHHHDLILGYCREFGVALEPFINENTAAYFHAMQAFQGRPQIAKQVITDVRGYISEMLGQAINSGSLPSGLNAAEQADWLALLQNYGSLDANYGYSGSSRAGFPGQTEADSCQRGTLLDPLDLGELLNSDFWQSQLNFTQSLDQQTSMLQPVGGMDNIARAFEARVGESIIYQAEVNAISKTTNGVSVSFIDSDNVQQVIESDFCLCTIPATVLRSITTDFSPQHQSAINSFAYAQSGKVAFQSPRFWEVENSIYGGISWTNQPITQIWYPSHGLGQTHGILVGAYTFNNADSLILRNLSPQARADWAIQEGSQIHPQLSTQTASSISVSWPKIPFQLGAWGASSPGVLTSADGNILFAGEHLSQLQGWQEGAVLSSYNAIDQIVAMSV